MAVAGGWDVAWGVSVISWDSRPLLAAPDCRLILPLQRSRQFVPDQGMAHYSSSPRNDDVSLAADVDAARAR
jgi:hypothetical protein